MRIGGMRIRCTHNFGKQNERFIGESVFFHYRVERNILTVMTELAIGHVEYDSVIDLCPVGVVRQENKLRIPVDESLDKPRATHAIHFYFLASDLFHHLLVVVGTSVIHAAFSIISVSQKRYNKCGVESLARSNA